MKDRKETNRDDFATKCFSSILLALAVQNLIVSCGLRCPSQMVVNIMNWWSTEHRTPNTIRSWLMPTTKCVRKAVGIRRKLSAARGQRVPHIFLSFIFHVLLIAATRYIRHVNQWDFSLSRVRRCTHSHTHRRQQPRFVSRSPSIMYVITPNVTVILLQIATHILKIETKNDNGNENERKMPKKKEMKEHRSCPALHCVKFERRNKSETSRHSVACTGHIVYHTWNTVCIAHCALCMHLSLRDIRLRMVFISREKEIMLEQQEGDLRSRNEKETCFVHHNNWNRPRGREEFVFCFIFFREFLNWPSVGRRIVIIYVFFTYMLYAYRTLSSYNVYNYTAVVRCSSIHPWSTRVCMCVCVCRARIYSLLVLWCFLFIIIDAISLRLLLLLVSMVHVWHYLGGYSIFVLRLPRARARFPITRRWQCHTH